MNVKLIGKGIALVRTGTWSLGSVSNRRNIIVFGAINFNSKHPEKRGFLWF